MIPGKRKNRTAPVLFVLALLLLVSACQGGDGKVDATKETDTGDGVYAPTMESGLPGDGGDQVPVSDKPAPGTILIDQEMTLNAFNTEPVNLPFQSQRDLVFRVDAKLTAGVLDYNLELVNSAGIVMAHLEARAGQSNISIKEFTAPFAGDYAVRIQPVSGGGTLQVVLTVMDAPSGGGTLSAVPGSMEASFYDSGVIQTFRFDLEADQLYTIGAFAALRGLPDTYLMLFGPDGGLLETVDDIQAPNDLNAVLLGFKPAQTGEYTALASPVNQSRGSYILSIGPGDELVPVVGEPDIAINSDYRAKFIDGDTLELTFDAALGDAISVEVVDLAEDLLIDVYLYSPYGQIIAYTAYDGTGSGRDQIISEIQLPYEGRYLLELIPVGSGEATFRILPLEAALLTGGGVFSDETVATRSGAFTASGAFHVYQFTAEAGDLVTLRLNSTTERGTLDIGFALISPDGLQVTFVDDVLGGEDLDPALVDYEVAESGTYTVIVYALTDGTGTYEIAYSKR